MTEESADLEQRNALFRLNPLISIVNSAITLAIAGAGFAWAIGQERTDATHTANIEKNTTVMHIKFAAVDSTNSRQDRDISQNRTEFLAVVKELRDEVAKMNEQNLRLRERLQERRAQ
jgi:hypothetical protein